MKEKILAEVLMRICKGYNTDFMPKKEFQQTFAEFSKKYGTAFNDCLEAYKSLKQSSNEEQFRKILKYSEEQFIEDNFTDRQPKDAMQKHGNLTYALRNAGAMWAEDLGTKLKVYKEYDPEQFKALKKDYKKFIKERNPNILKTFFEFFLENRSDIFPNSEGRSSLEHLNKNFREFIATIKEVQYQDFREFDLSSESPEESLEYLKKEYEKKYDVCLSMYDNVEKCLSQYVDGMTSFSDYCINVGKRQYYKDGYRLKNRFNILDPTPKSMRNGYSFENTQDCKEIDCDFVNVFILTPKGTLNKISVSPQRCLEYTPYIVFKQVQKISIVDDSVIEVHIHKHFDREIIVFEDAEKATSFQTKILNYMQGNRSFERPQRYPR